MKRLSVGYLNCLLLAGFIGLGTGCAVDNDTEDPDDDCGPMRQVSLRSTITSAGNFFELQTPEARNDCEVHYAFFFRWADPAKRAIDKDMPPIEDLAHAFQPLLEFTYFPHSPPTYEANRQVADSNGNVGKEFGWWVISFDIGNKNSPNPKTSYYVRARLDPAVASSLDNTEVMCYIDYYDKPVKK